MRSKLTSREIADAYYRLAEMASMAGEMEPGSEELERIDAEALEMLEALGEEAPEKLESLRAVALRLDGEARMLLAESKRLAGIARRLKREVERVRGYGAQILTAQREAGLPSKVKTEGGTFWLSTHKRLVGPEHISAWTEFGYTKTEIKPDRTAAKKALEAGETHPDFAIEAREVLNWR